MNIVSKRRTQHSTRIPGLHRVSAVRERRIILRRASLVCLFVVAACLAIFKPVLGQGTVDAHLNDSGVQPGREPLGAFASPAAFSGTERPDAASFQMNVPLLALAGRGLGVDLALHYDSSLYQIESTGSNQVGVFGKSKSLDWPASGFSLGYGKLVFHNARVLGCETYVIPATTYCGGVFFPPATVPPGSAQKTFIDGTGARHRLTNGKSVDSSDLLLRIESGIPTITYTDGTKIIFGKLTLSPAHVLPTEERECPDNGVIRRCCCTLYDENYFPTKILDRNGNYLQIDYVPNTTTGNIQSITDTLGRHINFNYSSSGLSSISVPDFTNGDAPQRTLVQFVYQNLTLSGCFIGQPQGCISGTTKVLAAVYFPATNTGWRYSYSSFGMIYRVEKMAGMTVDGANNITGQAIATTEYNYPGSSANPTANIPIELPKYTSRSDQWMDLNGTLLPTVTQTFAVDYFGTDRTSVATITAADQTTKSEITRRWYTAADHTNDYLTTWDEGIILKEKLTSGNTVYAVVERHWDNLATGPVLREQIVTNDAGDTRKTAYEYCPGPTSGQNGAFDNVCKVFEYKFNSTIFDSSTEVERAEFTYETDSAWTNRWLIRLLKSIKIFQGGSTQPIRKIDLSYDTNSLASYNSLPASYDPNTPGQRGNLTSVSASTNAADPANGATISATSAYDVFGNVVSHTDPNGNVTQMDYTDSFSDNQMRNTYAFLTSTTSAIPDPTPDPTAPHGSSEPLTTATTYNFATGLAISSRDVRGQFTTFSYDDPANRLTRTDLPGGGYTINEYSDVPGNTYLRVLNLQQTSPTVVTLERRQYFDGKGVNTRVCAFEGGSWLITDSQYDLVNRTSKVSNPYRATSPNGAINPSNIWTTSAYDPAGRIKTITAPGGAQTRVDYVGVLTLATDPTNKKRLTRSDELGQASDVWEITTDPGSEPVTFADQNLTGYHTQYYYDVLGNLRRVTQSSQQRFFSYDSLSRLIRVRNPEQEIRPSLALADTLTNNSGWTVAYDYDNNGNLRHRTDARGVLTTYTYDAIDRLTSRSYSNDPTGTPTVSFVYDSPAKGLLTSIASTVSTCQYSNYDALGRAKTITEQIGSQSYILNYDYDLVGHVKTLSYPANSPTQNHSANYSYDAAGRLQNFTGTLGDGSFRNYATGIAYDSSGGWSREQFGTTIPLYNKRHYNNRQMLYDMRVSTVDDDTNWNRGKIVNYYSLSNPVAGATGSDTNGSVYRQQHWIPTNDAIADYSYTQYDYSYDDLNRLRSSTEFQAGTDWLRPPAYVQTFDYDLWGNRTINPASWGVNNKQFDKTDAANTNRLYAPGDIPLPKEQRRMQYDEAGNLISDTYTGEGARVYDAEGRIVQAWANGQWQFYTYDGDGRRIKRKVNGVETWQVYGLGGELLAEYAAAGDPSHPQIEYGYRNGELLITATAPTTGGGGGPASLTTASTASVTLNWSPLSGAGNYRVERKGAGGNYASIGATASTNFIDGGAALGSAYLYRVCAADGNGNCTSNYSNIGLGAPANFPTDPTIVGYSEDSAHATTINVNHILELRAAVNAVRHLAGMGDAAWTHPVNHGDLIYVEDIRDLRQRLDEALGALGLPTPPYQTDSTLVGARESSNPTTIKAAHIRELRQRATNMQGNADVKLPLVAATCSRYHSEPYDDTQAIDGNYDDLWSAGDFAPQWIQVDLGQTRTISRVRLLVDQYPNGHTTHQVYGGPTPDNLSLLGTFDSDTVFHQWLELNAAVPNIRYVKVLTTASPSWVGWAEIEVFGPTPGIPAQTHWLVTDQLGTPRMIFDQSGSLTVTQSGNYVSGVIRHDYLPFGEELPLNLDGRTVGMGYGVADGVRQQFTQYERDETQLDFAQARSYSSVSGRFTRPDPMMASASLMNPQSWNRYTYCGNDPLNFIDPSGLDWYRNTDQTTGTIHPRWFDGIPDEPGNWVPWDLGFVYWNVEKKTWWWLNPHAFEQGPVGSELEGLTSVGHAEAAYADAHYQPPTPAYLAEFANEWNTKYVPAQNRAMNIMGSYMFFFTGPTGEMGEITSLGLEVTENSSTAISTLRMTTEGETFFHYGYAEHAEQFAGGLRPGSYATNAEGLSSVEAQLGLALPGGRQLPNAMYVIRPQPGTLIEVNPVIRSQFGQPGGLSEYFFLQGTGRGTVLGPFRIP